MGIHGSIHNLSLDIEFSSIEYPERIKWWELQINKYLETLLPPKLKILQGRNEIRRAQALTHLLNDAFIGHSFCLTWCMKFVASSQAFMLYLVKFGNMTFLRRYGWLHQEVKF